MSFLCDNNTCCIVQTQIACYNLFTIWVLEIAPQFYEIKTCTASYSPPIPPTQLPIPYLRGLAGVNWLDLVRRQQQSHFISCVPPLCRRGPHSRDYAHLVFLLPNGVCLFVWLEKISDGGADLRAGHDSSCDSTH